MVIWTYFPCLHANAEMVPRIQIVTSYFTYRPNLKSWKLFTWNPSELWRRVWCGNTPPHFTLKMEAAWNLATCTFRISNPITAQCHYPEDLDLKLHRRENLRSLKNYITFHWWPSKLFFFQHKIMCWEHQNSATTTLASSLSLQHIHFILVYILSAGRGGEYWEPCDYMMSLTPPACSLSTLTPIYVCILSQHK
jgi:hypothetical protein